MTRKLILKKVSKDRYRLFTAKGDPVTEAQHFYSVDEALEWAMRFASSWGDVSVELDVEEIK